MNRTLLALDNIGFEMIRWIEFESGPNSKMPVLADTLVEVQYTSGKGCTTVAGELYWWIEPNLPDAIARYKVVVDNPEIVT